MGSLDYFYKIVITHSTSANVQKFLQQVPSIIEADTLFVNECDSESKSFARRKPLFRPPEPKRQSHTRRFSLSTQNGFTNKDAPMASHCVAVEPLFAPRIGQLDVLPYVRGRLVFAGLAARLLITGKYHQLLMDLPHFMNDLEWLKYPLVTFQ